MTLPHTATNRLDASSFRGISVGAAICRGALALFIYRTGRLGVANQRAGESRSDVAISVPARTQPKRGDARPVCTIRGGHGMRLGPTRLATHALWGWPRETAASQFIPREGKRPRRRCSIRRWKGWERGD